MGEKHRKLLRRGAEEKRRGEITCEAGGRSLHRKQSLVGLGRAQRGSGYVAMKELMVVGQGHPFAVP